MAHANACRWMVALLALVLAAVGAADEPSFPQAKPLLPATGDWRMTDVCRPGRVGPRDFYFAEQGPYVRYEPDLTARFRQVGLLDRMVPGHANLPQRLESFTPTGQAKLSPSIRQLAQDYLTHQWPIHSIEYCTFQGNPSPSAAALQAVGDLWIGDGQPEECYRLEPVFHFIRTGQKWEGSSQGAWKDEAARDFYLQRLFPILDKELPFYRDLKHPWTRPELRKLCDLFSDEFYRPVGRAVAWGMNISPYQTACLPDTRCIGEKGADAFLAARGRGMLRQAGGGKFYYVWRGHEPTERWMYPRNSWFALRESWGYPLPLLRYYFFRPYLIGANYYTNEGSPGSLVQDPEGDGGYNLSTLGHIAKDMLDYADRHPDRGTPYAPVGLLGEYTREVPAPGAIGVTYFGYGLPFDEADHMNAGLTRLLFPEHRHTRFTGNYGNVAPYGEIFDILCPNEPGRPINPALLGNYKVMFGLGGLRIDAAYAARLKAYVAAGGTLVLNVGDLSPDLPASFFGVQVASEAREGKQATCLLDGKQFVEEPFAYTPLTLAGAEAVVTSDSAPLVTRMKVGRGHALLVGARYMIQKQVVPFKDERLLRTYDTRPLLQFVPDLLDHLTSGLGPVDFRCRPQDRHDLSFMVSRKGDGWLVTVFNYSLERELAVRPGGTANVIDEYPYRALPFEIVCRVPVQDVVECYEDRDVNWSLRDGQAVISESLRCGDIRVYEIQPQPIDLGTRSRPVNYALNRPVTVSSTLKGYSPRAAVDGKLNNDDYWQSGETKREFTTPQTLEVDLGAPKRIDHVFVLFHCWPLESLESRLRVYKYVIEGSLDRQNWQMLIGESRNEGPADRHGRERWFAPVEARYVRLTVLRNSAEAGAQVVELQVMGPARETVPAVRKSLVPPSQVQYPPEVRDVPANRQVFLADLKPQALQPGWMPAGAVWERLCGDVKLVADFSGQGTVYHKSLYAQTNFSATYAVPAGVTRFAAAVGIGAPARDASVVFQVLVDGQERYRSGLYRVGDPVAPVVVDVAGAKELQLIVTDGGDGITNDYAWWAEARFLKP